MNYNPLVWFLGIIGIGLLVSIIIFINTGKVGVVNKPMEEKPTNRKPAVAGSFYESEAIILRTQIRKLTENGPQSEENQNMKILIVPHAGINYSGGVAGAGFSYLKGKNYNKVFLIGASHKYSFEPAVIWNGGNWETPLGITGISTKMVEKLISPEQKMIGNTEYFLSEHSLEMELVFSQVVLDDFEIVPILLSNPSEETISATAYKIAENMDENSLLIISTDLSHYPTYEQAKIIDNETIESVLRNNKAEFEEVFGQQANLAETPACGYQAIRVGLKVAQLLNLQNSKLIGYQNSGDVGGDMNRVVGYAAIGFWGENQFRIPPLSASAQKEALVIARSAIEGKTLRSTNPELADPLGAFVTIRKNGQLRGCIGEFEPKKPLYQVIAEKAVAAATADPRFEPVKPEEWPDLEIEVSVMTPYQQIDDWRQIRPGVDGVLIRKGNKSGTYLPEVAVETGWELEEMLAHLCQEKAGLPANCYSDSETNIFVYQAQVIKPH